MGQFSDVHSDIIAGFCFISRNNWCIALALISSGLQQYMILFLYKLQERLGCARCNLTVGSDSRSCEDVPKTTEAKVKACLREISIFFSKYVPF